MGVSGHTNPPHETGVLPIKTTAEDGAANGMEDEMRKDEMDAGLKHSETGPCPEASSRGDILSCHGTGDASPRPTGSSSSLSPGDASLGTRESAGCIEGKSPTLSGRSCAQDGRTEHQGASVVGAQSHPEKSTHGGISSSGGLPSPALSQSSYVSFGLMSDGPLGGDAKNETRDEKVDDEEDVERARDVVNRSKGKKAESPAPVQSSSQPAAPQSAQAISNVPWAKDGTSPTTKLPIRFVDCVGRHYIFPWKKAKTWKGVKKLIESAFEHIDHLRPHVLAGHYDLTIQDVWVDPIASAIKASLASYPSTFDPLESAIASFTVAGPAPTIITPTSPPSHLLPKPCKGAMILPGLWDDIIEPGMMIKMLAWPGVARDEPRTAPAQPPSNPALGVGWPQPGRGRPRLPVPPPRDPKGKTRKRQDGL